MGIQNMNSVYLLGLLSPGPIYTHTHSSLVFPASRELEIVIWDSTWNDVLLLEYLLLSFRQWHFDTPLVAHLAMPCCCSQTCTIYLMSTRGLRFVLMGTGKGSYNTKNTAIGIYWQNLGYVVSWVKIEQFQKMRLISYFLH